MYRRKDPNLFAEGRISTVFQKQKESIADAINNQSENYILNVNEIEYVSHLENSYSLDIPEIQFSEAYVDSYEADIPAEFFERFNSMRFEGLPKSYKKEIIQYIIPCTGNATLLKYSPALQFSFGGGGGNFQVKESSLVTEIINFSNSPEDIKKQFEVEVNGIHSNYKTLLQDIESFNSTLQLHIKNEFNARKSKILSKNSLVASLGVPVKKRDAAPSTFSIPSPALRKKVIIKPEVSDVGFVPEPALHDSVYLDILKCINDIGKNFERMPSTYKSKGEEDLRDHILMVLDPLFEMGSAAGETFNKSGKTDIQLRYNSSVVFISECKFWTGEKGFLKTITQLLGYLTWRDTKASIVIFVNQRDISSIIDKATTCIGQHSNFLGYVSKSDENWFNYRFHINGDKNREVKLAVQLFHLP